MRPHLGLPEPAKIGITVGVVLGALLALLTAAVLVYRRRHRMRAKHVHDKTSAVAKGSTSGTARISTTNGTHVACLSAVANLQALQRCASHMCGILVTMCGASVYKPSSFGSARDASVHTKSEGGSS